MPVSALDVEKTATAKALPKTQYGMQKAAISRGAD